MENTFANNLQQLRLTKNLTQVQVAEALGVSSQSVSRWECGTTYPDIMLLPKIARLYCVTISDLYKQKPISYENYAHLLCTAYEASQNPDDFLRAIHEFEKLRLSNQYNDKEMYYYGIIHRTMINYCINKALNTFSDIINCTVLTDEAILGQARRQLQCLLDDIKCGYELVERELERFNIGIQKTNESTIK